MAPKNFYAKEGIKMRKKVDLNLEYREEGEVKNIKISIDFISNRVVKEFSNLIAEAAQVAKNHSRISDIDSILAGEKLTKKEIKDLKQEIKDLNNSILDFNNNGYFDRRSVVLNRILIDNGYKNNEMLMSDDFWEENVDPNDLMNFMYDAVYKDIDSKKKVTV